MVAEKSIFQIPEGAISRKNVRACGVQALRSSVVLRIASSILERRSGRISYRTCCEPQSVYPRKGLNSLHFRTSRAASHQKKGLYSTALATQRSRPRQPRLVYTDLTTGALFSGEVNSFAVLSGTEWPCSKLRLAINLHYYRSLKSHAVEFGRPSYVSRVR